MSLAEVDAVAVTAGPGLATAVQVGLAAGKALALALGIPLYGVHHLAAHAAADTLDHGPLPERGVALVVSGGHTSLLLLGDLTRDPITHLGDTRDDAAGEAFDKVARILGLPYPGGPAIDHAARHGNPQAVAFPRPLTCPADARYAFSFSGLKTAVARHVEHHLDRHGAGSLPVADLAASFQEAVVEVLTRKALAACHDHDVTTLLVVGGVAANHRLRTQAARCCAEAGITLRIPSPRLCTDNGAMTAALGDLLYRAGATPHGLGLAADPGAPLTTALIDTDTGAPHTATPPTVASTGGSSATPPSCYRDQPQ